MFKEIDRAAQAHRIPMSFSPRGSAFVFVLGVLVAIILTEALWPLALLLTYIPLHGAQVVANQVNAFEAPLADKNEGLSLTNIVIVVLGGALCVRALLSSVHWFAEKLGGGL